MITLVAAIVDGTYSSANATFSYSKQSLMRSNNSEDLKTDSILH